MSLSLQHPRPPSKGSDKKTAPQLSTLEQSLVRLLSEEGITKELAIEAIRATNCSSLEAAQTWLRNRFTSGSGLRGIRHLKNSPQKLESLSMSTPQTSNSGQFSRATSEILEANGGTKAAVPPWQLPSPVKSGTAAVRLQVRALDGSMIPLERRFYLTDSLMTVLKSILLQETSLQSTIPVIEKVVLAVAYPGTKYEWSQFASTTVEAAGLAPHATLLLMIDD